MDVIAPTFWLYKQKDAIQNVTNTIPRENLEKSYYIFQPQRSG